MVLKLWCFEDLEEKDRWINQSMTKVFVEQPQLNRVCLTYDDLDILRGQSNSCVSLALQTTNQTTNQTTTWI